MQRHLYCLCAIAFIAAMPAVTPLRAQNAPPAAVADYQARLARYSRLAAPMTSEASAYWDAVVEKRRVRNAKRRNNRADRPRRLRAHAAAGLCRAAAPGRSERAARRRRPAKRRRSR